MKFQLLLALGLLVIKYFYDILKNHENGEDPTSNIVLLVLWIANFVMSIFIY